MFQPAVAKELDRGHSSSPFSTSPF